MLGELEEVQNDIVPTIAQVRALYLGKRRCRQVRRGSDFHLHEALKSDLIRVLTWALKVRQMTILPPEWGMQIDKATGPSSSQLHGQLRSLLQRHWCISNAYLLSKEAFALRRDLTI